MRVRRRPGLTPEEMRTTYDHVYTGEAWPGHDERKRKTTALLDEYVHPDLLIADLACGDGAIVLNSNAGTKYLGDFVAASHLNVVGDIMDTVCHMPYADILVATEIIEHLEDPDEFLRRARERSTMIILSTPLDEVDYNPEHIWSWGQEDIDDMLRQADWHPQRCEVWMLQGWFPVQTWVAI